MKSNNIQFKALIESIQSVIQKHSIDKKLRNEVLLKITTIYALSIKGELPDGMKLDKNMANNKAEFDNLVVGLKNSDDIQIASVFSDDDALEKLTTPLIYSLITTFLDYPVDAVGSLAEDFVSASMMNHQSTDAIFANVSVCQLMSDVLDIHEDQSIYINSFTSLPMAVVASQKSKNVFYETINTTDLRVNALSLMSPYRFTISYTNFLDNPGYIVSENELRQFDYGLALPPMGARAKPKDRKAFDRFNRIVPKSSKLETLSTLHLIEQCKDKVVVSVTESTLFATIEKDFRQHLVDEGILKAVISLPPGIWAVTNVKTSLLVLEPKGGNDTVRFLDLTKTNLIKKTDNRLLEVTQLDEILSYLNSKEDLDCAISISKQEVQENNYLLPCDRYVLDINQKKVRALVAESETLTLSDIAELERGLPSSVKDGEVSIFEVTVNDLNEIGDISKPTKEVKVTKEDLKKSKSGILQPNDIVLIILGSVGKLGIVPEDISASNEYWMVSKPAIAIRVTSDNIDAKFLYTYLASEIGQIQLLDIAQGAAIDNISLKELRELPIILPSVEEQQQAIALVDESRQVQREIQTLKSDWFAKKDKLWSL